MVSYSNYNRRFNSQNVLHFFRTKTCLVCGKTSTRVTISHVIKENLSTGFESFDKKKNSLDIQSLSYHMKLTVF